MANNNVVVEEEEVAAPIDYSQDTVDPVTVYTLPVVTIEAYTQNISQDFVVTTKGDNKVLDKSGPFDTLVNAQAFGASILADLESGDLDPAVLLQNRA